MPTPTNQSAPQALPESASPGGLPVPDPDLVRQTRPAVRARLLVCLLPALVIAFAGHQRRWMSDDAYIYLRTVRQVLAGNGPVFNVGERAEASTGTIWQWLLVLAGLPGLDLAQAAVGLGLLLTAVGFALAAIAAARLHGAARVFPLGCLILLALPPVWDFATSGLETGLATCWLAGSWFLLVSRPESRVTSVVLGLGPLVRPDFGLVSVVLLAAQWLVTRPSWRVTAARWGAAAALPVGYEVFRAGYYGHLVPLPAVTKEASRSLWGRGFDYLDDFAGTYLLWVPVVLVLGGLLLSAWRDGRPSAHRSVMAAMAVMASASLPGRRGTPEDGTASSGSGARPVSRPRPRFRPVSARGRLVATALAPVVAGAASWVFVIRVGGDFMHGRMLLPGLLLMLLPVFVVPATRVWGCAAAAVGLWAVGCAGWLRVPYAGKIGPTGVADERGFYVSVNGTPNPVHHRYMGVRPGGGYAKTVREAGAVLVIKGSRPAVAGRGPAVTGVTVMLGYNGSVVPLSGAALDPIGLAYPLAAHSERVIGGRVGHDKRLPTEWIIAERADPVAFQGALPAHIDPARVEAAARALRCGPLAELHAATRAPLTPGRFWHNVTGAWQRTQFRFPNDPFHAERQLCGRP